MSKTRSACIINPANCQKISGTECQKYLKAAKKDHLFYRLSACSNLDNFMRHYGAGLPHVPDPEDPLEFILQQHGMRKGIHRDGDTELIACFRVEVKLVDLRDYALTANREFHDWVMVLDIGGESVACVKGLFPLGSLAFLEDSNIQGYNVSLDGSKSTLRRTCVHLANYLRCGKLAGYLDPKSFADDLTTLITAYRLISEVYWKTDDIAKRFTDQDGYGLFHLISGYELTALREIRDTAIERIS